MKYLIITPWRLLKDTPSKKKKVEKLFSGSANTNILKDSYNKLTVRCVKGVYYIFVNELLAGQFNNIKPEGNQVGFNVGTDSEISVDYLKVSILKSPTSPIIAENDAIKHDNVVSSRNITPELNPTAGPKITWVSPSGLKTNLETFTAKVKANIKSTSGLKSVLLYLNGVSKGEAEVKPATR